MRIAILTDSGSSLQAEEAKRLGIYLVPLQVIDATETFQDGVDITIQELYDRLRRNHTPKTSMPILAVIEEEIDKIKRAQFDMILSIPLSKGLSSTYQVIEMCAADKQIPVKTINNYTTCDLEGYLAKEAKRYVDEGMDVNTIIQRLNEKIETSGTIILPNDLQHLKRGGRLTPIAAAAAGFLKIRPVLKIDKETDGKIDVFEKVRTEKKAAAYAADYICNRLKGKAGVIYIIHSDCLARAEMMKELLSSQHKELDIHINYIYPVISAHTGLNCIAIQYIEK